MPDRKFGLDQKVLEEIIKTIKKYPVDKIILYGSRALGTFRDASDIDLTLVSSSMSFSDLLALENELDDLLLPYKIDLSVMNTIHKQSLLDHIRQHGVEL